MPPLPALASAFYDHPAGGVLPAYEYDRPGVRNLRMVSADTIDTSSVADPGRVPAAIMLASDATVLRALVVKYVATLPPPTLTADEQAIYDALVALGL